MSSRPAIRSWNLVEGAFCIRCRASIPGDPERPLCRACAADESPDEATQHYCLACGAPSDTRVDDPVCRPCRDRLYS